MPEIDHARGLCHKPNVPDGFFPREAAEADPPECKCCGSKLGMRDTGSLSFEQAGIYMLVCPVCP